MSLKPNQVVWAKAARDVWFPGAIVDPLRPVVGRGTPKLGQQHVFRIGVGTILAIPEESIVDFCFHFGDIFPKRDRTEQCEHSMEILVKLAAKKMGLEATGDWKQWGQENIRNCIELTLSGTFFDAVKRRKSSQKNNCSPAKTSQQSVQPRERQRRVAAERHPTPPLSATTSGRGPEVSSESPLAGLSSGPQKGQLVWMRTTATELELGWWPGVVLESLAPAEYTLLLLTKPPQMHLKTKQTDIKDFAYHFDQIFQSDSVHYQYRRAVVQAIQLVQNVASQGAQSVTEKTALAWAEKHLAQFTVCVIREEDLNSLLAMKAPTPSPSPQDSPPKPKIQKARKHITRKPPPLIPPPTSTKRKKETDEDDLPKKKKKMDERTEPQLDFIAKEESFIRKLTEKALSSAKRKPLETKEENPDGAGTPGKKKAAPTPKMTKKRLSAGGDFSESDKIRLRAPLDAGWVRELVYRKTTTAINRAGDVYYRPPDGSKKRRSIPDIKKYLEETHCKDFSPDEFSFAKITLQHPNQVVQGADRD